MARARFAEILTLLAAEEVEFLVVGMTAGILHGAPVTTLDVDVVHRRTPENVAGQTEEMRLAGGLAVRVLGLAALIDAKERSGRPKDLAALPVLRATLEEKNRPSLLPPDRG